MKYSIIIPVYNAENTIERCVNSLLLQDIDDIEIILVNNNSNDNSYNICQKLSLEYSCVYFINSEQSGASTARNIGLRFAKGDVIGFCDADDTFVPNSLRKVDLIFKNNSNIDIVITGFNKVTSNEKIIKSFSFKRTKRWSANKLINHTIYDCRIMGSVWNKFFKREILTDLFFDIDLTHCEDMHFVCRVLERNANLYIVVTDIISYNYYSNPQSITASVDKLFDDQGQLRYIVSLKKIILDCKLKKFTYKLIRREIFMLSSSIIQNKSISPEQEKVLEGYMNENIRYFYMLFYVSPKSSLKRFAKLKLMKKI